MNSLARLITATKHSGRTSAAWSKSGFKSKAVSSKRSTLASSFLRKAQMTKISSRALCTSSGFAQPVVPDHDLLPKIHHTTRPTGSDGFTRVTPDQLYVDLREGVHAVIVDIRSAVEFANWHLLGSVNLPAASFDVSQISDLPTSRPLYIIAGGGPTSTATAVKVAQTIKSQGHFVNIIEAGLKAFPDAGFMYYLDVDAEEARLKAIADAAAAAQKK